MFNIYYHYCCYYYYYFQRHLLLLKIKTIVNTLNLVHVYWLAAQKWAIQK